MDVGVRSPGPEVSSYGLGGVRSARGDDSGRPCGGQRGRRLGPYAARASVTIIVFPCRSMPFSTSEAVEWDRMGVDAWHSPWVFESTPDGLTR